MDSIEEVIEFYKKDIDSRIKHKSIYHLFIDNVNKYHGGILVRQFHALQGFGEPAFSWSWYLLVNALPENFRFLEIGVFKGRVLATVQLISNFLNKKCKIFGITPLDDSADKYSNYEKSDYLSDIKKSFQISGVSFDNTTIIQGYSQEPRVIDKAKEGEFYDMVFIDGCHDYEIVCQDIENYSKMLKVGGYLILDDASSRLDGACGAFLGHDDVARAVQDILEKYEHFVHIYAIGHNRIWLKIK